MFHKRNQQSIAEFQKIKKFILHCAGGYRSMIAASIFKTADGITLLTLLVVAEIKTLVF
jgi:rhodanese-related sulfurtransferase